MTHIILDASMTLPYYLADEDSRGVDALLDAVERGEALLLTTPHWRL